MLQFVSFLLLILLSANVTPQNSLLAQPDSAESAPDSIVYPLEEVVVTGTRYEKRIIDIPYAVYRLDSKEYQYARKTSASDVLSEVPGLFLQNRYGNHDVRVAIRGFGSRSNSGIRGVRILLDGIPESEPDGQTRIEAIDFNSVGRIEVVKGDASSLYPNAPGGVINFINDIYFPQSFLVSFNDFGEFNLRRNGFKLGVRTPDYGYLLTYSYHNYEGYRAHGGDFWHILNTVVDTKPSPKTDLQVLAYYVKGTLRIPGSLTREEFDENPWQAAQREVDFDYRRVSDKGRLGLRFSANLDDAKKHEIEVTTYGTIKYFERPSRIFRIINRYGLGGEARYLYKGALFGKRYEFSVGGDVLHQTGPIETYDNIGGIKSDILLDLRVGIIGSRGFYVQNYLDIIDNKLSVLWTGRYDFFYFEEINRLLEAQSDRLDYEKFTPKFGLNYKVNQSMSIYGSTGLSFRAPAGNELDYVPLPGPDGSLPPTSGRPIFNNNLKAADVISFELGVKGDLRNPEAAVFERMRIEASLYNTSIDKEIVPFEVLGDVFFRNAGKSTRRGLEFGASLAIYKGIGLNVAYTFSDYVYDEYEAETIFIDSTFQIVTAIADYAGNTPPSIPRHNFMGSLTFQHSICRSLSVFLKESMRSVSGMFVDDANSDKSDGFTTFSSTAGMDFSLPNRMNFLISGGVSNVFDKAFIEFININSANGRFYEAGAPRNFFASIQLGYTF